MSNLDARRLKNYSYCTTMNYERPSSPNALETNKTIIESTLYNDSFDPQIIHGAKLISIFNLIASQVRDPKKSKEQLRNEVYQRFNALGPGEYRDVSRKYHEDPEFKKNICYFFGFHKNLLISNKIKKPRET